MTDTPSSGPTFWTPATLFRAAVAGLIATAWSALLLAGLGHFHALAAALPGALAAAWFLRHPVPGASRWTRLDVAAVVLAAVSLILTLPPHLNLLGGWDPGVYLHTASALNRYGTLQLPEADLCTLSGETQALFARNLHGITEPFLGMRVVEGRYISPQFYHLYPSLMAVLWPLGGLSAGLLVNPLLNVLALLSVYALVRRLAGPAVGLLAMALLLLHPAQIWQARFSSAEMLTQTLLWSGFALLVRLDRPGSTGARDAWLAGCALGAAQLARYDSLMVLGPLAAVLLIGLLTPGPRRTTLWVLAPMAALAGHAWLHQKWIAPFYAPIPGLVQQAFLVIAALAVVLVALSLHPRGRALLQLALSGSALRVVALALFGVWWCFVLTIRPDLPDDTATARAVWSVLERVAPATMARNMAADDAQIGGYLLALWGWPALLAAMLGALLLVWRERGRMATAWLAGCLAVALVLTYRIYNDHFLMWLSRRYIPVVVPWFTVGLAVLCHQLTRRVPRAPVWAAAALALLLVAPRLPASYRMATLREWAGLDTWLEQAQSHLPADSILISDQPGFAAALRYLHGQRAYEINTRTPDYEPRLLAHLGQQQPRFPLFLLTQRTLPDDWSARFEPVARLPLKTGRLNHTRRALPSDLKSRGGDFALYRWKETSP